MAVSIVMHKLHIAEDRLLKQLRGCFSTWSAVKTADNTTGGGDAVVDLRIHLAPLWGDGEPGGVAPVAACQPRLSFTTLKVTKPTQMLGSFRSDLFLEDTKLWSS